MTTKIALVDGHYPSISEITGLEFDISIVMQAFDLTQEQQRLRQQQAERLVTAWNAHDQLVAALKLARERLALAAESAFDVRTLPIIDEALAAAGE